MADIRTYKYFVDGEWRSAATFMVAGKAAQLILA